MTKPRIHAVQFTFGHLCFGFIIECSVPILYNIFVHIIYKLTVIWSMKVTLKFIEHLHALPCLWDDLSTDFKNINKRKDSAEVDKKIHNLKCLFGREHKKLSDAKKSGCSPKKCNWLGYDALLFLVASNTSIGSRNMYTTETQIENLEEEVISRKSGEGNENQDIFRLPDTARCLKKKIKLLKMP